MTLGVVPIKYVIAPVMQSSPELFSDPLLDFSIYVKDITEEEEPFVGQGLVSNLLNKGPMDEDTLVPGRVCSNFAGLLTNKGPTDTLEIRLRLVRVTRRPSEQHSQQQQPAPQKPQSHPQQQMNQRPNQNPRTQQYLRRSSLSQQQFPEKRKHDDLDTEDEAEQFQFAQPKPLQNRRQPRYVNTAPAPKAARTQSLPTFDGVLNAVPPIARFPPQSIARRIYLADKNNLRQHSSYDPNSSPVEISTDVSKRFAPDFISKPPNFSKSDPGRKSTTLKKSTSAVNSTTKKAEKKIQQKSKAPVNSELLPLMDDDIPKPPVCFHCKTYESKSWRWKESDDDSKRGLLCYQCHHYWKSNGVMRPQRLINRQNQSRQKKKEKNQASSSPTSSGNDTMPTSGTPFGGDKSAKELPSQYYSNSSDPMHELDEMVSELDFHFGPMTDIDPLPQEMVGEDKENIPPRPSIQQQRQPPPPPVSVRRASRQTSFEKMLAKSFSGVPPPVSHSPGDWMTDLFHTEPTPKDQDQLENNVTPRDFDNTPRDITTCNTLPCNEESPESDPVKAQQQQQTQQNNKLKVSAAMPSSPLMMVPESDELSSPQTMMTSEWAVEGEETRLNSHQDSLPPKAHFTHDPHLGVDFATQ
jgi:hypothetical protein